MAKLGGVQMCMIHGGHGWLLSQWFSTLNNHRTDSFGGSIENRARIALMMSSRGGPLFGGHFHATQNDLARWRQVAG